MEVLHELKTIMEDRDEWEKRVETVLGCPEGRPKYMLLKTKECDLWAIRLLCLASRVNT